MPSTAGNTIYGNTSSLPWPIVVCLKSCCDEIGFGLEEDHNATVVAFEWRFKHIMVFWGYLHLDCESF